MINIKDFQCPGIFTQSIVGWLAYGWSFVSMALAGGTGDGCQSVVMISSKRAAIVIIIFIDEIWRRF